MARTFVDDSYNYFDEVDRVSQIKRKTRLSGLGLGESTPSNNSGIGNILSGLNFFKPKQDKRSRFNFLSLFRDKLLKLKDLKNQLTMVKGTSVTNSINAQINQLQKEIFDLEKKFIGSFRDTQGAKNVINSVVSNPDISINDNTLAQNFLTQAENQSPNVVTPVPVAEGGYETPSQGQQEPQQGTEVVDKTIEPKKNNTLLYIGIGIVAVILLTRK